MTSVDLELPRWAEVTTRTVEDAERPYRSGESHLPVVVEAREFTSAARLREFVEANSDELKKTMHAYGAILFRGFDVASDADFEGLVTAFDAAQPMTGYFMSEKGRDKIEGTHAVFNTNSLFKTGGGRYLGGFHSENFYSTDVPSVQSFWCKEPPTLGGETALVQSAGIYDDLPKSLQDKLAAEKVLARVIPLTAVADRYGMTEAQAEDFCREIGLDIVDGHALLYKPAVYRHPGTGRLAVQVNLSNEVMGLDHNLRKMIAPNYRGAAWAVSRLGWRNPAIASILPALQSWPMFKGLVSSIFRKPATAEVPAGVQKAMENRLTTRLDADDVQALADAIAAHLSVVTWRKGDVLIFDNFQLLHAGMPGRGRRELHVMMCDPIDMPQPVGAGIFEPPAKSNHETVDVRAEQFALQR